MSLQQLVQLHERIEIYYAVTHYEAQLFTADGEKLVATVSGESPEDALTILAIRCRANGWVSYTDIRKAPSLPEPRLVTPAWSSRGSLDQLSQELGIQLQVGWNETDRDTALVTREGDELVLSVWNRTGVREQLQALISQPVFKS